MPTRVVPPVSKVISLKGVSGVAFGADCAAGRDPAVHAITRANAAVAAHAFRCVPVMDLLLRTHPTPAARPTRADDAQATDAGAARTPVRV